jgi:hypothetical protein
MTQPNNSTAQPASLAIRMLVGAGIGFCIISFFVFGFEPNPAWGKYWMIRPLIITPLAGAVGGLCNYFIMSFHHQYGVNKIAAMIISVIIFLFGLWVGIILGLDGTQWD